MGSVLALGMNPEAQVCISVTIGLVPLGAIQLYYSYDQVHPRGKGQYAPAKKLEGGLQRHLALPFMKGPVPH